MQLIHPAHQDKISSGHSTRQIIDAAPTDPESLRLTGDRQIVAPVDYRFALSNPALPSAPAKKSFSSVSAPILA